MIFEFKASLFVVRSLCIAVSSFCLSSSSFCFSSTLTRTLLNSSSIARSYVLMVVTYSALLRKSAMFSDENRIWSRERFPPSYMNLILSFMASYCAASFNCAAARSSLAFSTSADNSSIWAEAASKSALKDDNWLFRSFKSFLRPEVVISSSFAEGAQ